MRISLEEERRALLEQIEARRGLYRRILSGKDEDHQRTSTHRQAFGQAMSPQHNRFAQWLLDHPVQVATGVALLVWLGPRLIRRNQGRSKTAAQMHQGGQRSGNLRIITRMMALLLRDPRQLQMTAGMVGKAWRWIRRATTTQTPTHGRKPYA